MTLPRRLESFGAALRARCTETGARLHPPLSNEAIGDYQKRHGVTLPDAYLAVISMVANGWERDESYKIVGVSPLADHPNLSKPFPHPAAHVVNDVDDDVVVEAPGLLTLSEDDSGQVWYLVVTGAARGTVWLYDEQSSSLGHLFGVVDFFERTLDPASMIREEEDYPLQDSGWQDPPRAARRYRVTGFSEIYAMTALDGRPLAQVLGDPVANQKMSRTGASQAFERGTMTWISGQGITAVDADGNVVFKNF
jgi:hypothetical protein